VERDLHDLGVHSVAIPRTSKPTAARRAFEHRRAFRAKVKWRTGSEGRINHIKRSYGWNRTELTGTNGARTWCGHRGLRPQSRQDRRPRSMKPTPRGAEQHQPPSPPTVTTITNGFSGRSSYAGSIPVARSKSSALIGQFLWRRMDLRSRRLYLLVPTAMPREAALGAQPGRMSPASPRAQQNRPAPEGPIGCYDRGLSTDPELPYLRCLPIPD
jgi:transposase, IS5 family